MWFRRPIYLKVELHPEAAFSMVTCGKEWLLGRCTEQLIEQLREHGVRVKPAK